MFRGAIATTTSGAALAEQISRHGRLYFRLAYGVLRDAAAAEDVCQQAMLKAWERRAEAREDAALRGWVARIVLNESLQVRRRRQIERRAMAEHASRPSPDASASAEHLAIRESVLAAMEQLPEATRLVVAMRVMQGMSGNEVKDLLGCSAAEDITPVPRRSVRDRRRHSIDLGQCPIMCIPFGTGFALGTYEQAHQQYFLGERPCRTALP